MMTLMCAWRRNVLVDDCMLVFPVYCAYGVTLSLAGTTGVWVQVIGKRQSAVSTRLFVHNMFNILLSL